MGVVIIILVAVVIVLWLIFIRKKGYRHNWDDQVNVAEDVLKGRLDRGDITLEDYNRKMKRLHEIAKD